MSQSGYSVIELLVVVAIMGLTAGMTAATLAPAALPVDSGATQLETLFGAARARAMATTSAYRVTAPTADNVRVEHAATCGATTWTDDPDLELELPAEVSMTDTSWTVCFSSRGVASFNTVIDLVHPRSRSRQVEVLVGGSARIVP